MTFKNYIIAFIAFILAFFLIQNSHKTEITFLFWTFESYLSVIFSISFILGIVIHWLYSLGKRVIKPKNTI